MEENRRKVYKNSAATFLDRGAKLIHRVFCPHPSLPGFSDVLMCCTETCSCGTGRLLSVRHSVQVSHLLQELPQDSETISTLVRPRFPTETALGGELYATYNSKDFFGRDEHTKFYVMGLVVATEFLHKRNNYEMMATDVIIVAENIDHETTKDLGFESHVENLNSNLTMASDVINVAGIIDHETLKNYDFETFIVLSVAGNTDSENVNDFGLHVYEQHTEFEAEQSVAHHEKPSGVVNRATVNVALLRCGTFGAVGLVGNKNREFMNSDSCF